MARQTTAKISLIYLSSCTIAVFENILLICVCLYLPDSRYVVMMFWYMIIRYKYQ